MGSHRTTLRSGSTLIESNLQRFLKAQNTAHFISHQERVSRVLYIDQIGNWTHIFDKKIGLKGVWKERWSQFTCVCLCLLQHCDAFFHRFRQVRLRLRCRLTRCVGEARQGLIGGVCHCGEGGGHREGKSLSSTWWVGCIADKILGFNIGLGRWMSKLLFHFRQLREAAPHPQDWLSVQRAWGSFLNQQS